jgi:hypothetical protein
VISNTVFCRAPHFVLWGTLTQHVRQPSRTQKTQSFSRKPLFLKAIRAA